MHERLTKLAGIKSTTIVAGAVDVVEPPSPTPTPIDASTFKALDVPERSSLATIPAVPTPVISIESLCDVIHVESRSFIFNRLVGE